MPLRRNSGIRPARDVQRKTTLWSRFKIKNDRVLGPSCGCSCCSLLLTTTGTMKLKMVLGLELFTQTHSTQHVVVVDTTPTTVLQEKITIKRIIIVYVHTNLLCRFQCPSDKWHTTCFVHQLNPSTSTP